MCVRVCVCEREREKERERERERESVFLRVCVCVCVCSRLVVLDVFDVCILSAIDNLFLLFLQNHFCMLAGIFRFLSIEKSCHGVV